MLQKLENIYLNILRFVVILVASILLVVVAFTGINALLAMRLEPVPKDIVPKVPAQSLVDELTHSEAASTLGKPATTLQPTPKVDTNQAYYERAAKAIGQFIEKGSQGQEKADLQQITQIVKSRAEGQDDEKLTAAHAREFAETMEKTFSNDAVLQRARRSSPIEVANQALNLFTEKFHHDVLQAKGEQSQKQLEYQQKKAEGIQSLYMALGTFATFLSIVFLSLVIRIERNLRYLAPVKADKPVV